MAQLRINQIEHANLVALGFEQFSGIAQQFTFRIETNERSIRLHDVRFCVEPRFTGTASADNKYIDVAPVLSPIQTDPHMIRQQFILIGLICCILVIDVSCCSPLCRTVLLSAPVVLSGCKVDADSHPIDQQKQKDCFRTVLAPLDCKWFLHPV